MAWEISAGFRPFDQYMEPDVSTTLMALPDPISPGKCFHSYSSAPISPGSFMLQQQSLKNGRSTS